LIENRFRTFVSETAGSGKSFLIRSLRCDWQKYAYISTTGTDRFVSSIESLSKIAWNSIVSDDEYLVHIDLFDTTSNEIDSYLFELIFCWGFYDSVSGFNVLLHPLLTFFRVELATGPLRNRLMVPFLGEVDIVHPDRHTFVSSRKELKKGMGKLRFYGRRYDGTSMRKEAQGIRPATAYERLQYVATALNVVERNHGRFPLFFEAPNVSERQGVLVNLRQTFALSMSLNESDPLGLSLEDSELCDISGNECYDLLVKHSRMDPSKMSLWCLWNYINMVYWQLRMMQYEDSPLLKTLALSPEPANSNEKILDKELMKGQFFQFLTDTAREFATRQVADSTHLKVFPFLLSIIFLYRSIFVSLFLFPLFSLYTLFPHFPFQFLFFHIRFYTFLFFSLSSLSISYFH
jgi:hypothetical protein